MYIENSYISKHSIKVENVYSIFIYLLIISSLLGSKIFGIEVAGFTLFMDRIVLALILFLFWPKITKRIIFTNKSIYLFIPMILISFIILISQAIFGINSEYIVQSIKFLVLYIEFSIFMSLIYILPKKINMHKIFVYTMYLILIVGILETIGVKVLSFRIFEILPKTAQQYKDINAIYYRGEHIRISSFYTHSLAFGTILSLYIPYIYYLYKNDILSRFSFVLSLLLSNYCLFMTYSRTALATTIVFYLFIFIKNILFKNKSILYKIISIFIAIVLCILTSNIIISNINIFFPDGSNDESISMRLDDYKFIKQGLEEAPILGLGTGAYRDKYMNAIDNFYLTILYENGIIGLMLLIIFILFNFRYLNNEIVGEHTYTIKSIFFMVILYNLTMDAFGFIEIMKFYIIIIVLSSKSYKIKE